MNDMIIEVPQGVDELGEREELTWDLFPLVDASKTTHLDASGLPKVGTRIEPGMIIVGKIGKTRRYDRDRQPGALEVHSLQISDLKEKYGDMWYNSSLYADESQVGIVRRAYLENRGESTVAVVVIDQV